MTTVLLGAMMRVADGASWSQVVRHAPLTALSAQTTTGFSTIPPAELGGGAKAVTMVAMFLGGGVGSTAGGIKMLRVLILLQVLHVCIRRTALPPHAVLEPRLAGRTIEPGEIRDTIALLLAFLGVIVLSWLAFLAYGHDPMDALFDVVSATGTVGLSSGVTGPDLAAPLKGVLAVDMLVGRLEILAFLVLLYPPTWIGRRRESS